MNFQETSLKDCFILKPNVYQDGRGYFFESFNQKLFEKLTGQTGHFVQDNQSCSSYGVIRGLHFQSGKYAQAKLIRVISGKVYDVAVDLREDSPTFRRWFGMELNSHDHQQLYIPRGFAHGFSVLADNTVIAYKCDQLYNKASEGGIHFRDPSLNIDWKIPASHQILSDRDKELPVLKSLVY